MPPIPLSPSGDITPEQALNLVEHAPLASEFLKVMGQENRLTILCHLVGGEKSVTDLERLLSARQAAISQQLARLRMEGLVNFRREGKAIYYRLSDGRAARIIEVLHDQFCGDDMRGAR